MAICFLPRLAGDAVGKHVAFGPHAKDIVPDVIFHRITVTIAAVARILGGTRGMLIHTIAFVHRIIWQRLQVSPMPFITRTVFSVRDRR